jgi:hypothetical protein
VEIEVRITIAGDRSPIDLTPETDELVADLNGGRAAPSQDAGAVIPLDNEPRPADEQMP